MEIDFTLLDLEVIDPILFVAGKPCMHSDISIVVLEVYGTCEKTALQCDLCGLIINKKIRC